MSDDPARKHAMRFDDVRSSPVGPRRSTELGGDEALALLGSVSLGRIVFTRHALPTIRPVNHVLDGGDIVIRTHEGAALTSRTHEAGAPGVVVAYEADLIDPGTHLGWSVVVTGYARLVTDPVELARYQAVLRPWVERTMDYAVRIVPDLITGIRLTEAHPSERSKPSESSAKV
ncbi:pyridoxamine 5'-phosphate oxidase family protein [Streptomyces sp. NPDC057363]|uniref:pyridoxamine 5'-phosphate oxidase family protein n=2 Tax=unclassified Streptomyces TaxID=2593676 RepID=UPI003627D930